MKRSDSTDHEASRAAFAARLAGIVARHRSAERFAKDIGVSPSALRKWLKGQTEPRRNTLIALARAAGVSVEWLATGEGPARRGRDTADLPPGLAEAGPVYRAAPSDEYVRVPRYEATIAMRGDARVRNDQIVDHLAFKADWVARRLDVDANNLLLIEAAADWIERGTRRHDLLLLDVADRPIRHNALYVVEVDGDLIAKRIRKKLDGTLIVSGCTSEAMTEEIAPGAVSSLPLVGRVLWIGRRL